MSVRLTEQPFDPGVELTAFTSGRSETGAVATFTGIARAEKGRTAILELEAYPGFTESEIGKIADEARVRWSLDDLLVVHRTGQIAPGEPIVFVATASEHRQEAFAAAEFLMDFMKTRAPFWKREHLADGTAGAWVEASGEDDRADIHAPARQRRDLVGG